MFTTSPLWNWTKCQFLPVNKERCLITEYTYIRRFKFNIRLSLEDPYSQVSTHCLFHLSTWFWIYHEVYISHNAIKKVVNSLVNWIFKRICGKQQSIFISFCFPCVPNFSYFREYFVSFLLSVSFPLWCFEVMAHLLPLWTTHTLIVKHIHNLKKF